MINVAELVNDPDFAQPNGITVRRRKLSFVDYKQVIEEIELNFKGIITINNDASVEMLNTADRNEDAITIVTTEKLFLAGKVGSEEYLADIILFNESEYKMESIKNNKQYGYYSSTAVRQEQEMV